MYSKFHSLINDFWLTPLLANESEDDETNQDVSFSSPIGKQQTNLKMTSWIVITDDHVVNIPI